MKQVRLQQDALVCCNHTFRSTAFTKLVTDERTNKRTNGQTDGNRKDRSTTLRVRPA